METPTVTQVISQIQTSADWVIDFGTDDDIVREMLRLQAAQTMTLISIAENVNLIRKFLEAQEPKSEA